LILTVIISLIQYSDTPATAMLIN